MTGRLLEVRLNLYKACGSFTTSLSFTTEQTQGSVESSLLVLYNVQKNGKLASYSLTVGGFMLSVGGKVFKNFK